MGRLSRYDPAEYLKKRYCLKGWQAELVDFIMGAIAAALIYYVILPLILGANPAAVVVPSCSMTGTIDIGDVIVLLGADPTTINAPLVEMSNDTVYFEIFPDSFTEETQKLIFPAGSPREVHLDEKGTTIVYNSKITGTQIIHRVIAKLMMPDGSYRYLTKGDANYVPDAAKPECVAYGEKGQCAKARNRQGGLCAYPQDAGSNLCLGAVLEQKDIVGRYWFTIPKIGHLTLFFTLRHPWQWSCV